MRGIAKSPPTPPRAHRPSAWRVPMLRRLSRALVLPLMIVISGCLVESTVDSKGGAVLKVQYRLTNENQLDAVKKQMQSPEVTLVDASVDKDKFATFNIKVADVTKLST